LALGCGLLFLPLSRWFLLAQGAIEARGAIGPVILILAYILLTVLLIPGSALSLGAATLFGFWRGLFIVLLGANAGALCAFLLARTLLRARVRQWTVDNPKFAALDRAIGQHGFKMVFLARLSPVFPFTLLNYLFGLTPVRITSYVLANVLGMLPGTFLYVYLGATARAALAGQATNSTTWLPLTLRVIGLLATLAIVALITRTARQALAQAEAEAEANRSALSENT
jgi:uncharacterized membrane protein YdjX (TVP38/TMEM64 family)